MSANEIDAYKAAMASVRDMTINPESGRVVRTSNKSIVENIQNLHKDPAFKNIDVKLSGKADEDSAKIINAYKKDVLNQQIITRPKPMTEEVSKSENPMILKVGNRNDETSYMSALAEKCKRSKK